MKQLVLFCVLLLGYLSVKAQRKSFQIDSVYIIAVKDTFCLTEADFCWVFNYHSHKNYADKNESVLIADFTCIKNNVAENKHLIFDGLPPYTWKHDNFLFTILEYDYDNSMKVRTSIVRE
jgi:hypothetical protein